MTIVGRKKTDFTPTQKIVIELVQQGHSTNEIAALKGWKPGYVQWVRSQITIRRFQIEQYKKLEAIHG